MDEGYSVITDRYYFSSYAYHSVHMDMDWVIQANALSAQLLRPDLNIYIDIDPETSISRLHAGRNHFELYETIGNLKLVRNKYLEVIKKLEHEEKTVIIDGNQPADAVAAAIWNAVSTLLVSAPDIAV